MQRNLAQFVKKNRGETVASGMLAGVATVFLISIKWRTAINKKNKYIASLIFQQVLQHGE
ncbi:MAG TPA: hypothetical protein VHB48_11210 [Chitinophagaceae bacterium]|nr:hypothetical protein [Chitinophagaceae bacterium]